MAQGTVSSKRRARGASAIEFAFILPVMVALLWGIVSFGSIFMVQLALSGAVSDGARAAASLPQADEDEIRQLVLDTLKASGISHPTGDGIDVSFPAGNCPGGPCIRVRIEATYAELRGTPVLPAITLPFIGSMSWLPETLVAEASALR
jgi:hypothetical protein